LPDRECTVVFGLVQSGKMKLDRFIDEIYVPWAKVNKRSWKGDALTMTLLMGHKDLKTTLRYSRTVQPQAIKRLSNWHLSLSLTLERRFLFFIFAHAELGYLVHEWNGRQFSARNGASALFFNNACREFF
jgi:hypothetical protein